MIEYQTLFKAPKLLEGLFPVRVTVGVVRLGAVQPASGEERKIAKVDTTILVKVLRQVHGAEVA
jgi:hypothetical protein